MNYVTLMRENFLPKLNKTTFISYEVAQINSILYDEKFFDASLIHSFTNFLMGKGKKTKDPIKTYLVNTIPI